LTAVDALDRKAARSDLRFQGRRIADVEARLIVFNSYRDCPQPTSRRGY